MKFQVHLIQKVNGISICCKQRMYYSINCRHRLSVRECLPGTLNNKGFVQETADALAKISLSFRVYDISCKAFVYNLLTKLSTFSVPSSVDITPAPLGLSCAAMAPALCYDAPSYSELLAAKWEASGKVESSVACLPSIGQVAS
jgi:hypothetical protein